MEKDVARGFILSSENSLDFHAEIYFVLAVTLKYLRIGLNSK